LQLLHDDDPPPGTGGTTLSDIQNFVYWLWLMPSLSGSPLEDLRAFPLTARREAGHQLDQVQNGREPDDWKPMNTVGQGVKEIRIRDEAGAFRILYVAKFADAVYVLHCFQKKTEKTSKADVELAAKRYRELLKERGQ
jgi:phage-related protein